MQLELKIQLNLSLSLKRLYCYKESLQVLDYAIEKCKSYGNVLQFAQLLVNKGQILCAINEKTKGISVLKDAFRLCHLVHKANCIKLICKNTKSFL